MKNKITLITPPDFFENLSLSLLLIDITETDQETITQWLSSSTNEKDLNLYYYSEDNDPKWLLSAVNKSDLIFIDVDNLSYQVQLLLGYILSKKNVYYQTRVEETIQALKLINGNQLPDIRYFLDEILSPTISE
jgi:hypothetical protein